MRGGGGGNQMRKRQHGFSGGGRRVADQGGRRGNMGLLGEGRVLRTKEHYQNILSYILYDFCKEDKFANLRISQKILL